ncbi:MAG: twin-arginine translocase subunit TatC [Phycisphaerae bacterium]
MSFGDHLEELRNCLIRALAGVVIGTIVALIFGKDILEIIYRPLLIAQHANGLAPHLQVLAPTAAFTAYLKIGFLSGLIVAMPWVLYQVWFFVTTGLYPHERRWVRALVPASLGLFAIGVLFLYFIVLPIVLHFFIRFNKAFGTPDLTPTAFQSLLLGEEEAVPTAPESAADLQVPVRSRDPENPKDGELWWNETTRRLTLKTVSEVWSISLEPGATHNAMKSEFAIDFYVSFVLVLALAFGIAFETPIVVFFLAWSGIVTRAAMKRGRRYVLLATVIAAAALTPPDVISQLLLAGPMYLLFELGLLVARMVEGKRPEVQEGV